VQAYAYRTAANLATEIIRRRGCRAAHWRRIVAHQRARLGPSDQPSADNIDQDHGGVVGRLRGALRALPRHLREVVVLRDLAQMPYCRVASILGIRPTTARVYRRQAVIRLGDALSRDMAAGPR
jgi:DNA-directed RNA polymerase specialized sigma24 family protein